MSNINPNNINDAYPVAGVDNDSQGFRDNFKNIKTNFAFAASELADLQSKVVLKSALNNSTLNNNFAGALISGAEIRDLRETSFDNGVVSSSLVLDHTTGHYQRATTSGNGIGTSIGFANVPASGKIGRFRLKLTVANSADSLLLPTSVTVGKNFVTEYNATNNSIGFTSSGTGVYYFEFLTDDGGTSFTIQDITRGNSVRNYNYVGALTDGQTVTVTNKLILDASTSSVGNVNIMFPTTPVDGQSISITTGKVLGNLTLMANTVAGTTIIGNVSSLSAAQVLGWTYVSTANKWYPSL